MNASLIYVVGPSGAGKDSLLQWLRAQVPASGPVAWARRTINRPCVPGGEVHESVDSTEFNRLLETQAFAMHWAANDHLYGLRNAEFKPLAQKQCLLVNGSRAHLPEAALHYPGLTVLHITADLEILKQRLRSRGRESCLAIENRLHRSVNVEVPPGCRLIEIHNNDRLELAGERLMQALRSVAHWPAQ